MRTRWKPPHSLVCYRSAVPPTALFWSFHLQSPSFRHRMAPVAAELERRGWRCELVELRGGRYFRRLADRADVLGAADLVVLAKINLGFGEERLLARLADRVAFDLDDATYLRQRKTLGAPPEVSCIRLARFSRTVGICHLVTAGNQRLAHVAGRFTRHVEIVPTTVEIGERPPAPPRDGRTLVWIGLDRNLVYLELVRPALARLARRFPDLRLRIVCDTWPDWDDVPIERVEWSEAVEENALRTADVGLMPLTDDPWTRGKCSFKLLQYMAAGLPTVASPVGTNRDVVRDGESGLLARTEDEWHEALRRLLESAELRAVMGRAGFEHARRHYARRPTVRRHADLYEALLDGAGPA